METRAAAGPDLDALLSRWRATGKPAVMAEIFDAAAPGLFRMALHLAPDAAAAEDALQETFLALLESAGRGAEVRAAGPWLSGTLRNKVLRGRRSAARLPDPLRLEPRILASDPPTEAARAEEAARVREALEALPEPYREVAILRWRYGVEPAAIAHARGVPPGTVRSLLSRAAGKLRAALGCIMFGYFDARPGRGLGEVRSRVLEAARAAAPGQAAAASVLLLGGALVAKKTLGIAAVLALVLLGGWYGWRRGGGEDPGAGSRDSRVEAAPLPIASTPREEKGAAAGNAAPPLPPSAPDDAVEAFPTPADAGSLLVRLAWEGGGEPAAGIEVRVHSWDGPDPYLHVRSARTGADGTALLEGLPPGRADLRGPGGFGRTAIIERGERSELSLRIRRGVLVEGVVVDGEGVPVEGAAVVLETMTEGGAVLALSGADGAFSIGSVDPHTRLGARAPGRAPSAIHRVDAAKGATVRLRMVLPGPGGAIEGRVLSPDGRPVAGARVQVRPEFWYRQVVLEDGTPTVPQAGFEVRTDRRGAFRFDGVEPGRSQVRVRTERLAPGEATVEVVAGQVTPLDFRLGPGAILEGTVKDRTGAPVEGANVRAHGPGEFLGSFASTDAGGRYRLEGLAPGSVLLAAEKDGRGKASATVEVAADAPARWDPVLDAGSILAGRVLAPDGSPRAGWAVHARTAEPGSSWQDSAVTGVDGSFLIRNCWSAGLRVEVRPRVPGGSFADFPSLVLTEVNPGAGELLITVPEENLPTAFLAGAVVDGAGKPLGGAQVAVARGVDFSTPYRFADPETGRFRVGPLPPGDWEVTISAKGLPPVSLGRRRLEAGDEVDLGVIALREGGTVEARIRREDGKPLNRPWGEVLAGDGAVAAQFHSEGGVGRAGPVAPGSYLLRVEETVSAEETLLALVPVEVRAGERTSVDVTLLLVGRRSFRARTADGGEPEGKVRLRVRDAGGRWVRTFTWNLPTSLPLPSGSYVVEAETEGGLRGEASFAVGGPGGGEEGAVVIPGK